MATVIGIVCGNMRGGNFGIGRAEKPIIDNGASPCEIVAA
jgi:hypothetical protein